METVVHLRVVGRTGLLVVLLLTAGCTRSPRYGVDAHLDSMERVLIEGIDLGQRLNSGHVDLPRLRDGAVNVPFLALWVPAYYHGAEAVRRMLDMRDAAQRMVDAHAQEIEIAGNARDIERIVRAGRIAAVITVEGGHQIDNDLGVLRMYYRLGIRCMTLTHLRSNDWADSSTDKPAHKGLTEFGKDVVREMNRLGMLVDISHVSDKTFYDTLAVSTQPIIVSHSCCRALCNIPRNVTDDMLRALAKNGGVIGINFGSGFLNQEGTDALMRAISGISAAEPNLTGKALDDYAAEEYRSILNYQGNATATVDDMVKHIEHVVRVAGIDYVGLGSDFDGGIHPPKGLEDISKRAVLRQALKGKGYQDADIDKIMGGNFWRVIQRVLK
jgi:membrane dipeptidase